MKKYVVIVAIFISGIKAELHEGVQREESSVLKKSVSGMYHALSSFEINAAHEDYDKMCDELPSKPISRWQIMLARVGTPVLTTYIAVRRYIIRQFYKWHHLLLSTKKIVKSR